MIQSNISLLYDARNGQRWGIIEIEIATWITTKEGISYDVIDYVINENVREFVASKTVFRSWDQLNSLNDYLLVNNNYDGLNLKEQEFKKVQHALLIETQTNPVYGSVAANWILTPEE